MAASPFTVITGVNTLFNALLQQPEFAKLDFPPCDRPRRRDGGAAGRRENAGRRSPARPWPRPTASPRPRRRCASTRWICPSSTIPSACRSSSTDISLRDDDGYEVPLGMPGELCVKGPQVMKGYWYQRPEDTARLHPTATCAPATWPPSTSQLRAHRRPQEGHDPGVRLQRLSERGRGRGGPHPGARGGDRRADEHRARRSRSSSSARTPASPPRR